MSVTLSICDASHSGQRWQASEVNINPIIHETHPKLTLEDVILAKDDFKENPILSSDANSNSSYNWGQLYTKHNEAKYCVTAKGLLLPLTMEPCRSPISGIDPSQYFELTINYTIRLVKTNNCINSFTSNSVLLPCNTNSQIWGKNFLTGQIMNGNMKSLEHDNANLFVGLCDFNLQNQHWMFAFYNPKVDSYIKPILTSARIVAMRANLSLSSEPLEFSLPPISTTNHAQFVEIPKSHLPLESASHSRAADSKKSGQEIETIDIFEDGSNSSSPIVRLNMSEFSKRYLHPIHEQYKVGLQVDHENKLARESRQLYCEITTLKKNQAVLLSQTNGILAAVALDLPICSRLKGLGETVMLQQCVKKSVNISAIETECGFQPYFSYKNMNYTIGTDGWSIHPFSDCFWKSQYVTLNGKPYKWKKLNRTWDWIKQEKTIHYSNLDLISEFQEVKLNDFNYELKAHPAHNLNDLESINVLTDLIGHIENSKSETLSDVVISRKQISNFDHLLDWSDKLKLIITIVFSLIFLLFLLKAISYYFQRSSKRPNAVHFLRRVRVSRLDSVDREHSPQESVRMLNIPAAPPLPPAAMPRDPLSLARGLLTFRSTPPPSPPPSPPSSHVAHSDTSPPTPEKPPRKKLRIQIPPRTESPPPLPESSPPLSEQVTPTKVVDTSFTQSPPTTSVPHTHTTCTYVVGKGLVWEDLCPCQPTTSIEIYNSP